ncbi:AAA family ATPase [Dehalococcoidales bacterium]|nr:AAA family ATPase [Dehalococcoidales bacterium]
MIKRLFIQNFRSLRNIVMDLAPLTVLYGPNGAGKSSLIYALLTLRQIFSNSNQPLDALFNFTFINLGNFKAVVYNHRDELPIELKIEGLYDDFKLLYQVTLNPQKSTFALKLGDKGTFNIVATFPYPVNQRASLSIPWDSESYQVVWDGVNVIQCEGPSGQEQKATQLMETLNSLGRELRSAEVVPLRRGFTRPYYIPVGLGPIIITDDELATFIGRDPYVHGSISSYLENITGRDFRIFTPPGSSTIYLQSVDRKTALTDDLVNNGFGINQLVYLLAKCLKAEAHLIWIEEPEIHLHPRAVRRLAETLSEIATNEKKQFLISSHSETLALTFLDLVAQEKLKSDNLAFYFVQRKGKDTHLKQQAVKPNGQIEGGLLSFMEAELEGLKAFLKIR